MPIDTRPRRGYVQFPTLEEQQQQLELEQLRQRLNEQARQQQITRPFLGRQAEAGLLQLQGQAATAQPGFQRELARVPIEQQTIASRGDVNRQLAANLGGREQAQILAGGRVREAEILGRAQQAEALGRLQQEALTQAGSTGRTQIEQAGLGLRSQFGPTGDYATLNEQDLVGLARTGDVRALLQLLKNKVGNAATDAELMQAIQDGSFLEFAPEYRFLIDQAFGSPIDTQPR